jgi:folate-binding protein YgfZ
MLNFYVQKAGVIVASGNDRMDFFNRMSTNDLTNFPVNTYRKTVFTNDKGRIVDFVTLINLQDSTLILASPGLEDELVTHLDKYIIMDDVKLDKPVHEFYKLSAWGDNILDNINSALGYEIKNDNTIAMPGDDVYVYYDEYRVPSVNFIGANGASGSIDKLDEIKSALLNSISNAKELSEQEFEIFRIKHGIALPGNEITELINPVECGLNEYISYNKGCYIGQEVISRLDAQGKIPKQMILITSENGIAKDDKIFSGDMDEKKEAGFISSTTKDNEGNIGLGFIRSVSLDFDKDYFVESNGVQTKIKISKI